MYNRNNLTDVPLNNYDIYLLLCPLLLPSCVPSCPSPPVSWLIVIRAASSTVETARSI